MKTIKVMAAMEVEISDKMYEILEAGNYPPNDYFIVLGDEEDRPGLWIQINNKSANLGNIYNQDVVEIIKIDEAQKMQDKLKTNIQFPISESNRL